MPWLSRRSSTEEAIKRVDDDCKRSEKGPAIPAVSFIPAQIDGLCGTMPIHHKQAASRLLWGNLRVLVQSLGSLPAMATAACLIERLRSSFKNPVGARDALLQILLAAAQSWMLLILVPAFLSLPGFLFGALIAASWLFTLAMTWPLSGHRVLISRCEKASIADGISDERWIFVNGMMCSNHSLRNQCDRLSSIFGRPVKGIHNGTSGFIMDLILFLLQRCLNNPTPCTLALGSEVRDACLTNSVRKVILIGHNTGALHISIALDQLYATLPIDVLSKIEVYTFGSAAAHLSNPCLAIETHDSGTFNYTRPDGSIISPVKATLASLGHRVEDHERVIPHMEHYALNADIFARCGVLHNTRSALDNLFCGRVFVINDNNMTRRNEGMVSSKGRGFMLIEHYLDMLFPTNSRGDVDVLNQVVEVDMETAEKREFTAQGVALPQKPINRFSGASKPDSPNVSPKTKNRTSWEITVSVNGVVKARTAARECEGKTVKQLSRLWRYAHGGRPIGEGVAVVNGASKAAGKV